METFGGVRGALKTLAPEFLVRTANTVGKHFRPMRRNG